MTQEDKDLLLRDLCARLPYGVKLKGRCDVTTLLQIRVIEDRIVILTTTWCGEIKAFYKENLDECKPYLRPMSSMTEEEKTELQKVIKNNPIKPFGELTNKCDNLTRSVAYGAVDIISYLLSKHFDIYNLIERNLALEAPEGMYNIKEQ